MVGVAEPFGDAVSVFNEVGANDFVWECDAVTGICFVP
jgi:hypothetical protein